MGTFSETKIEEIWQKARLIDKETFINPIVQASNDEFRLDDLGAIIKKSEYGTESDFGWEIDHILPLSKGGTDNSINLQVLHWKNNRIKADDFPKINVATGTTFGNNYVNIEKSSIKPTLHFDVINELRKVYPGNPYLEQ